MQWLHTTTTPADGRTTGAKNERACESACRYPNDTYDTQWAIKFDVPPVGGGGCSYLTVVVERLRVVGGLLFGPVRQEVAGEWLRWYGDMAATAVVAVMPVVAAPVAVWAVVPVWAAVVAVWCAYPIVGGSAAYVGFRYRS